MKRYSGKPNYLLRHEREQRGWSQARVAEELYNRGGARIRGGINEKMVSRWELGKYPPSPFYQEKLCLLFGKTAEELGFLEVPLSEESEAKADEPEHAPERPQTVVSSSLQHGSQVALTPHQAIDLLCAVQDGCGEEQVGAWLALGATDFAPLFESHWSLEDVLTSLQVVLKGVQAMSNITRRTLLRLGAAAVVSSVPIPDSKHVSVEDRINLHTALGESIAAGWKLFHTAGNAQVLAVGQAQLYLVQQSHTLLYPSVQPLFYSAVYRLIGAALHFRGHYEQAYREQEKAYISALEGADAWNMAQSRSWQAYGLKARWNYPEALEAADAALRLVSQHRDTESIRLRARLLAFSAENAALLDDVQQVQARLDASEALLEYLPGHHEEFDRVSWLQQAGMCALSLKQYDLAMTRLQQALDELPAQWTLRTVATAVPLATTLTRLGELDEALAIARKTMPVVKALQSAALTQQVQTYLQEELLASFPHDEQCRSFVRDAQQQLALA
jgi:tetratricopeptide (TPR) repeat protein